MFDTFFFFPFLPEFLNVDDDEVAEDEDENMPSCTEETRLLENTGWSSRTRCVCLMCLVLFLICSNTFPVKRGSID
jgi:hypothetical protein